MGTAAYLIEIQKTVPRHTLSQTKLRKAAAGMLKALGWKKAGVSILLVSDRQIRPLNKRHLGHDWATDIISFSQLEGKSLKASPQTTPLLGDLVISLDTAARQAREYGNDFFYELCFYVCHGILHLMGHSDKTARQAAWMEKKQTAVLRKIGIKNGHSKNARHHS